MTDTEKLNLCRVMLDKNADESSWSDDVLSVYIKIAGRKIIAKAYPYEKDVTEVPDKYSELQCEIAVYLLNKRGAEGELTHSENGISRTYENADVPKSMLNSIVPCCGVF